MLRVVQFIEQVHVGWRLQLRMIVGAYSGKILSKRMFVAPSSGLKRYYSPKGEASLHGVLPGSKSWCATVNRCTDPEWQRRQGAGGK